MTPDTAEKDEEILGSTRSKTMAMKYQRPVTQSLSSGIDLGFVVIGQAPEEPTSFKGAWFHPYTTERKEWHNAIKEELQSMKLKKVWSIIDVSDKPKGK